MDLWRSLLFFFFALGFSPFAVALNPFSPKVEALQFKISGYTRVFQGIHNLSRCIDTVVRNALGDYVFFEFDPTKQLCSLYWKIFTAEKTPGQNNTLFYSAYKDWDHKEAFQLYCTDECHYGWKKFANRCFKLDYLENHTHLRQRDYLRTLDTQCAQNTVVKTAVAASISRKEENEFISDLLKANEVSEAVIGLRRDDIGDFNWADGRTFSKFTNWDIDEPSLGSDEVITLLSFDGKWHDDIPKSAPIVCSYNICDF